MTKRRAPRRESTGEYASKGTASEMKRKVDLLCGRGAATIRKIKHGSSKGLYDLHVKPSCRRWADIYNPHLVAEAAHRRRNAR